MTTPKTFGFQIEGDRRQKTEDRRQKMKKLPLHVAGTCSPSLSLEHSVPSSDQLL